MAMPPLAGLVAAGCVILGVLLFMFVAEGYLAVAGLGAFGPGILRELGVLRDHDEFQRQAAHRAGYHAYLIGGLVTAFVVSALRSRDATIEASPDWVMLILVVMWTTWMFSGLLAYWGARKTTSRLLTVFGSFWAVFVIASIIGESDNTVEVLLGVLMGFVVVGPFFVLAWTAARWPRGTGAALLTVSALFLLLFSPRWASGALDLSSVLVTVTVLLVPLVATGMALLLEGQQPEEGVPSPDEAE
jgi:hypothetical protein